MRKNGTTTRLIDAAVQHLFTKGSLKLLSQDDLNHLSREERRHPTKELEVSLKFVDPAAKKGNNAQEEFIQRFMMRLAMEHIDRYVFGVGLIFISK